jgi:hypothetical protein
MNMEKNTNASPAALATLKKMEEACKAVTGIKNLWHQKGSDFVMDISNRFHDDGAITGRIQRVGKADANGVRPSRLVGTIRIEGDGKLTRAHAFLANAARQMKEARDKREAEEKALLSKRNITKFMASPKKLSLVKDAKPINTNTLAPQTQQALNEKPVQTAEEIHNAQVARAAHARKAKMQKDYEYYKQKMADLEQRMKGAPNPEPKAAAPVAKKEVSPDELAVKRARAAHAREVLAQKRAAAKNNQPSAS